MKILVVDDEKNIRESLKCILELEKFEVDVAENGLSGQRLIQENHYDAAIFDLKMPGMTGLELLEYLGESETFLPVIMISAFGQVEDAVRALKLGAHDYVVKPFDPDELIAKLQILVGGLCEEQGDESDTIQSEKMAKVEKRIARIAKSQSTVLLTGESGVGKEVNARKIHSLSQSCDSPFMALNMGGMPESLIESELFGYEKGAFTGADKMKQGLLELAGGGTLFLDEIGEVPGALQVKLLRVLQERTFRRLGGLKDIAIKSRLITATNRNLEEMVQEGTFREDLFYRLNVARVELPALRDRLEDLPQLVNALLEKLNKKMDLEVTKLQHDAWEALRRYSFPGNIRELENILERAMIFVDGDTISLEDLELPQTVSSNEKVEEVPSSGTKTLKELEKETIIETLHRWEGNRSKAAIELGVSRRTIINKIKEYDID